MARKALNSLSSSCSTYYDIKTTMIIYIVFEVAMNGLFDINLSIYTYLWSEECILNSSMLDMSILLIFEIKWNMGWIENEVFSLS